MIIHVDMDAYYASIEQRDNPKLRGLPVVVGGSPDGRGVVAAASYEARKFGIHSAMSMRKAIGLCPQLTIIKSRIDYYAALSKQIQRIFYEFTPIVEPLSLDEAFLDVTHTAHLFGDAESIGREIKSRIENDLGLIASVGIAPNKFLAKVASDLRKPNAFVVVEPMTLETFLDPLPIERIWGVGQVTANVFRKHSIHTIGDLRRWKLPELQVLFGKSAQHYWELARGIDKRSVVPEREAKSISSETTFSQDIHEREILDGWLALLVEVVSRRLRNNAYQGKGVELKVRYHDFQSTTRSMMLSDPTDRTDTFLHSANSLLDRIPFDGRPIRLLGFGIHHLSQTTVRQLSLWDQSECDKQRDLDAVSDEITGKFGRGAIQRGISKARHTK